jgi:Flp pilus assembly pilin Flp
MRRSVRTLIRRLSIAEVAQVTVEYALVISVVVAVLVGVSAMVLGGLSTHYQEVTSVVCLPIP